VVLLRRVCTSPRGGLRRSPFFSSSSDLAWWRGVEVEDGESSGLLPPFQARPPSLLWGSCRFLPHLASRGGRGWVRRVQRPPERVEESRSLQRFGFLRRFLCDDLCVLLQSKAIGLAMPRSTTTTRSRASFSSVRGSLAELLQQRSPLPSQVVMSPAGTGVAPPRLYKPPTCSRDRIAFVRSSLGCLL
jgi:hypothetical protein